MAYERIGLATAALALGACLACTVTNDDSGFTSVATSATASVGTMTNGDSGSGGSSSGTGGSTGEATSGTGGDDTAGSGETTAATLDPTGGSSGAVDPTDGQPADGMWSMCLMGEDCGNTPILCIQSVDADMNPIDGFCSTTGCMNAAVDCLPAPGGTAMPACAPITVDGEMEMACVLNCQGLMCPMGMVCMNFTGLGMICM
jgi:hypothetical protein